MSINTWPFHATSSVIGKQVPQSASKFCEPVFQIRISFCGPLLQAEINTAENQPLRNCCELIDIRYKYLPVMSDRSLTASE